MRFMFLDLAGDEDLTRSANALARAMAAAGEQVVCVGMDSQGTPMAAERGVVRLPGLGFDRRAPDLVVDEDDDATVDGEQAARALREAQEEAQDLATLRQARVKALATRLRPDIIVATTAAGAEAEDGAPMADLAEIGAGSRARWAAMVAAGTGDPPQLVLDGRRRPAEPTALAAALTALAPPRRPAGGTLDLAVPRDGSMVRDGLLRIAGVVLGGGALRRVWVEVNDGLPQPLDLGSAFPGPGQAVTGAVDVRAEGCRLALRFGAETAWGETVELGGSAAGRVAWQPRHLPATPRILPLVVDAAIHAAAGQLRLRGRLTAPGHPDEVRDVELEAWQAGVRIPLALDAQARFQADLAATSCAGIHLWARFADERRRDAHLCTLWPDPASPAEPPSPAAGHAQAERPPAWAPRAWIGEAGTLVAFDGPDAPRGPGTGVVLNGRPAEWITDHGAPGHARLPAEVDVLTVELIHADSAGSACTVQPSRLAPGEAFRRARRMGRMMTLVPVAGAAQTVHPLRLQPAGSDWALVVRRGMAIENLPLAGVARIDLADTAWSALADRAVARELREHGNRQRPPARPLSADLPPPMVLSLPEGPRREAPRVIDRVLLIRPGAFPTDDLYVLHPLPPVLREMGLDLTVLTVGDEAEAEPPPLTAASVVIVSRQASPAWIDRLARSPAFVVYLVDDDIPAAADSPGMSHDFRRRMMELLASDMAPLLRRCDRLLITSPGLAARYASAKTEVIAPPYVRPPAGLDHLAAPEVIHMTYQGTESHHEDIEFLFPALGRVLERHDNVRCSLFGRRALPAPLKGHPRVEILKPMSWGDYMAFTVANPAHIALVPMLDTPFNRGKSILKVLDAASLGAAGIFSDVLPFNGVVRDGADGLLVANDPERWEAAIAALIAAPERIATLAAAGQARARALGAIEEASAVWRRLLGRAPVPADTSDGACGMDRSP